MKLHINSKYKNLTPRPSDDDYRSMKEDIKKHGQRLPIAVNEDGVIIDGYTRYQICKELGKKAKHAVIPRKYPELEKGLIISMNAKRRHLNIFQKAEMAESLLKEEKKEAKKRMKKGTSSPPDVRGTATAKAAKTVGIGARTLERALYVKEKADKEMTKKLENGSMAINTAYSILTREKRNLPKQKLPKGEFDVVYADPGTQFDNRSIRGSADNHYDTMTAEKIAKMKLPVGNNAVLFLWMQSSLIMDGTADTILNGWGFEGITFFTWVKDRIGVGSWLRNQTEHLIIAVKGKMPTPAKLYSSVIEAPRGEHSAKPNKVYDMIERMYPKRKYIELFARTKRAGWISYGNELEPQKIWVCKICGNNKEIPKEEWSPHLRKKYTGTLPYPDEHYFIQIEK